MANLNFAVDEPGSEGGYDPIPPNVYVMAITDSDVVATKNGAGKYLKLAHEIVEGPMAGRKIFNNLNLWNSNEKTVKIAKAQLNGLLKACGFTTGQSISDSAELHGIPFQAEIGVDKGSDQYGPQNIVKRYISGETGADTQAQTKKVAAVAKTAVKPPWQK